MKCKGLFVCALGLLIGVSSAGASTLYGSTSAGGAGNLWILNPATGAGVLNVGSLNDAGGANYAVTGLAFDPVNGVLYGSTGGKSGTELLSIDPATARVTVIGQYNTGHNGCTMSDLACDAGGNLFGIGSAGGPTLYSIDKATGQATAIGSSGLSGTSGGGLAISPAGVFFGTPQTADFGTYNSTTGAYTNITNPTKPAGSTASYAALAFDGSTLYGMNLGSPTHLVTFDSAGNVTDIGQSVPSIDGIAFVVPEPTTAALAGLLLALTAVGRRRS